MKTSRQFRGDAGFWRGLILAVLCLRGLNAGAAPPDPGWVQIWGDEFDGTATRTNQSGLDLDKWATRLPWLNSGLNDRWFHDNDLAWIADENTFVTNGNLVIRAKAGPPATWSGHDTFNYSHGWVHSKNTFDYRFGYAEIQSQSSSGSAMWPAWWYVGYSGWPPEVDVFERYPSGTVQQGVYYAGAGGAGTWDSAFFTADPIYNMRTWGFEWSPGYIGLSKDGLVRNTLTGSYGINEPMYMILSSGLVTNTAGGTFDNQSFPDDFIIDYVRVYKRAEHVYNSDFAFNTGAWLTLNTNTIVSIGGGVGGGDALALANGADAITPSAASQLVYGLMPDTRYWVGGDLKSGGTPVSVGVNGYGGASIEQATNSASYAPVNFIFTNGLFSSTANVFARLDAGAGFSGNVDNLQLRRAAAVSDPGFEVNDPKLYWGESYGSVSVSTTLPRSGKCSVAVTAAASAAHQTVVGLLPNTTYQLSAWIRNNGNAQPAMLGVKDFGGAQVSVLTSATANANYLPFSVTFTTGSTNTTGSIFVYVNTYNGVPIYADDFLLVEPLAAPWQQADIGAVGLVGAGGQRGSGFDVRGAGSDIWGTADSFRMISRAVTNDCRITARVLKVDPTDSSAKAGITLRESTTAGARHVTIDWLPQQAVECLWRSTVSGSTLAQWAPGKVATAPWVRLERVGNVFTSSWSPDGVHWNVVTSQTLVLPSVLQAGVVVCAHNSAQLNEGVFSDVSVGSPTTRTAEDLSWNAAGAGGNWDTTSASWLNAAASPVVWSNALSDSATFGATGAGVVSLVTNIKVRSLTFDNAGYTITNQTMTLASGVVVANADATIASALGGAAGLNKSGAGTLIVSGSNSYGGGTTVSAGTLRLGGSQPLGLTNGSVNALGGILDLGGVSRWAGAVTIAGGVISNGTLTATAYDGQSGTVTAVLAGSNVALTKTGSGLLTLAATNTYSGGTILKGGTLSIAAAGNLGSASNPLKFAGGLLQITGLTLTNLNSQNVNWSTFAGGFDIATPANTFTVTNMISGGGSLIKNGAGTLRLTAKNSYAAGNSTINAGTAENYSGATVINGGILLLTNSGGIYDGVTGFPVIVNSGGVLSLSGDVGYTSAALGLLAAQPGAFLLNGGTFQHTGPGNAKSGQPGAGRLFSVGELGGTLDSATAGQEFSLGYRYDYGADVLSPLGGNLTLTGVGNGDFNYGYNGSGGLVKSGAGTWKLTGANYSHSGPTVVSNGTLLVQGVLSNSPVLVAGGTFGGNNIIYQPVTVQAGGRLAPGVNTLGTLTLRSNLTLLAGSQLAVEVNATSGARDLLAGLNNVSYAGTLVVANLSGTVTNRQSFQLSSATTASGNFSAISPTSPATGLIWVFNPNTGILSAQVTGYLSPTNITASLTGTNLTLSWPASHLGWTLLQQTNHLALGVSSDSTDWMRIAGSSTNTQYNVLIDQTKAASFYRLIYP